MKRQGIIIGAVIVVTVAVVVGWLLSSMFLYEGLKETTKQEAKPPRGPRAPDFSLMDLNGTVFKLSDFRGKVVVLDFMATWCEPCRRQIPYLNVVKERYGDLVAIVSIVINPISSEAIKEFLRGYPYAKWIWVIDTANVWRIYNVSAIPTLFIIDREGNIRFKHIGLTEPSVLIEEIDKILKEG
ncbi:MAG: TlpA disulfide reductase family protein [Nitrososphaerota archaeon]|nr:TlpA family protein disulfide reductase [Candidatus Nezhaarchaeota archaeon]MDW8050054.1 TlpA disulfide reductase family protein [Nitrososphaerota archaeon]